MQEAEITAVKGKIVKGVFALTSRTFILQIIAFCANLVLTILLSPSIYGVFFIVSALISFLGYFADIGLAAALIQKQDEPTISELRTVFTIQQLLVGSVVLIGLLNSSQIGSFYKLEGAGVFLFQALLISFFLSSLKTIPSVLLERKLEFQGLVIPQIIETSVFYIVAVILAATGFGITSFAWAALFRGIAGFIVISIISPWKIGFAFTINTMKQLLKFGVPFQTNSLLALVKDDLLTLFLGKALPFSQVGYIGWAKKWAEVPLRLIMDSVVRVTFPAYSRLAHNKEILGIAIGKSIFFLSFFILPATVLLIFTISPLVYIIPRYIKWEPALVSFYLFAIAGIFSSYSSTLTNALNAIGKIKTTLVLMVMWTALTWILVPILIVQTGFNGFAIAALSISFTGVIPVYLMRKQIEFQIFQNIYKPLIGSVCMAIPFIIFLPRLHNAGILLITLSVSIGIYTLYSFTFMKSDILPYFHKFIKK